MHGNAKIKNLPLRKSQNRFLENIVFLSMRTHEGRSPTDQELLSSFFWRQIGLIQTRKILRGYGLLGFPSGVIVILLEFQPMVGYIPVNRMTVFRPEILPTDRSTCNQNALKISDQKNVFFMRYSISKNHSYPTKDVGISCFLEIEYPTKETFF